MPSMQRKAITERALYFWKSTLPWSTRLKGVLCSPLRFMWIALMLLTVLCVSVQILGVIRQSRNDKVLKEFANEKLFSMRFTIAFQNTLTTTQRASERRQSNHVPLIQYIQHLNQGTTLRRERHNQQSAERTRNIPHLEVQPQRGRALSVRVPNDAPPPRGHIGKATKVTPSLKGTRGKLVPAAAETVPEVGNYHPLGMQKNTSKSIWPAASVTSGVLRPQVGLAVVMSHEGRGNLLAPKGRASGPQSIQLEPQRSADPLPNAQRQPGPKSKALLGRKSPSLALTTLHLPSTADTGFAVVKPAAIVAVDRGATTCRPKTHIVFLKTHKTASSTILNILYRYGDSRNLTFALPLNKHSQLFYPLYFAAHFVEGFRSKAVKEYDIMCNHMRFMPSEVKKVMPEDTFYFSILRNPIPMMESIFTYYKSIPAFHKARTLDDFLNNAWQTYNKSQSNNHYGKNLLTFDFGFNNTAVDIERQTSLSVSMIEQNFHLILISEYFDESMILLKNALCWSLDDVVSFKLNSRSNRTRHELSPETMEKIKEWNSLDWRIYLHFNATFWRKVEEMVGLENMRQEVARLQDRQKQLMKTCIREGGAVDPSQVKDSALKPFQYGAAVIQGYNLNPGLDNATKKHCQDLITPELQYTAALYTKQFPELAAKLGSSKKQPVPKKIIARSTTERQRRSLLGGPRKQARSAYQNALSNGTAANRLQNVP
ncbi:galactose-3-O-sulfotransferase 2 [Megalops cyprinoides]|uniref:galactose-3-O-sulfotransferase 2 n=1 Tax=Megalops cyprinoides TaxID=118141 RepID=UPI001864AC80|nr:galactose-3-O-sulfotransferase 2 [Megalops cyprinoides]